MKTKNPSVGVCLGNHCAQMFNSSWLLCLTSLLGESRTLKIGPRRILSKSYDYCRMNTSLDSGRKERANLKSIGQSRSLDLLDSDDKNVTSDSVSTLFWIHFAPAVNMWCTHLWKLGYLSNGKKFQLRLITWLMLNDLSGLLVGP